MVGGLGGGSLGNPYGAQIAVDPPYACTLLQALARAAAGTTPGAQLPETSFLTVLEAGRPDQHVTGSVVPPDGRDGGSVLGVSPGLLGGRLLSESSRSRSPVSTRPPDVSEVCVSSIPSSHKDDPGHVG